MRAAAALVLAGILSACGSSTDTQPTRYNFAVVDGANQKSTAGDAVLAKPITAQLTRDPQGKFATRVFELFAPAVAYAQGLSLPGDPVANAIVCGREANLGEPQVVPLCAFTLADGKAPNVVEPGTKAGVYNMVFTAQVASQLPVKDSTTVVVEPGSPVDMALLDAPNGRTLEVGASLDLRPLVVFVRDQYANNIDWSKMTPGIALRDGSEPGQPSPDASSWTITWDQSWSGRRAYVYVWFGNARASFPLDFK